MLRDVKKGSTGPDVRAIQEGLNLRNRQDFQAGKIPGAKQAPVIGVDGSFGSETEGSVRDFQKRQGLTPDGVVGPKTRAALFPLAVETATVVGVQLRPPNRPTLKDRVLAGFSPGKLRLNGGAPDPPPITPNPNGNVIHLPDDLGANPNPKLINLPADLLSDFTPQRFWPRLFPGLPLPVAVPEVPEVTVPTSSSIFNADIGPWKYDHSELVPGVQTTLPFRGARQDAFTYTLQRIYTQGDPKGKHLEWTSGVQYGAPLTAAFSNGSIWTVTYQSQITDVDRFGALGSFHWWQPYAQAGFALSTGPDLNPTASLSVVPLNLGLDLGDNLTLTLNCGATFGFNPFSGAGMLGGQCAGGASIKFGAPDPPTPRQDDDPPNPTKRYW